MIRYEFEFNKDNIVRFACDPNGYTSVETGNETVSDWMRLDRHRCPDCEVPIGSRVTCPAALSLVPVLKEFSTRISHEKVKVTVHRPEEDIRVEGTTSIQQAMRSLIGLILALSSCPTMMHLRPMAHFHLPFGDTKHTLFRVVGSYLIAQYMRKAGGLEPDWSLDGLLDIYSRIHTINSTLAARLREAAEKDAAVNSVVILDILGYEVETSIETELNALKPLFAIYFKE